MRMRVIIDPEKCIAAGECVRASASVFGQDEDSGIVFLVDETPPQSLLEDVRRAARLCPAAAIVIDEDA
jgi:ferredoxin